MENKWLIIAMLFPVFSFSQNSAPKGELAAITSVGIAGGESIAKPLFQVTTGVNFHTWFVGLGGGADQYRFESYPVFADWRLNFGKQQVGFVYANAGYHFPSHSKATDDEFLTTDKLQGGFYMDAGVGYRVKLGALHRLLFSAGYSQKDVKNTVGFTFPCLVPPCPEEIYNYQYRLGRVVAKLSWEFGKMK